MASAGLEEPYEKCTEQEAKCVLWGLESSQRLVPAPRTSMRMNVSIIAYKSCKFLIIGEGQASLLGAGWNENASEKKHVRICLLLRWPRTADSGAEIIYIWDIGCRIFFN